MALTRPKYSQIYDTDWKQSVELATTADVGNLVLANVQPNSIDGVTVLTNYRILVKDQDSGAQNGIYLVRNAGTGSNGWWTRSLDALTSDRVTAGLAVNVISGSVNGGKEFKLTTPDPITLGTTVLTFIDPNAAAGAGGANTQVQFNDASILGGTAGFTFNKYSNVLTVGGFVNSAGNISASQLNAKTLVARNDYGNINFTQFNSIFADANASQNIVVIQASTTGLSDGMGMLGSTGLDSSLYSSRGIAFRTGATMRNTDVPTGGVIKVAITAAGDLWANATTPSTSTTTGALVVKGGVGVGGNVNASYFLGNGALLTGIVAGSSYSNVQVATYLPTYTGNIGKIYYDPNNGFVGFNDTSPDYVYDFYTPDNAGEILHIEGGVGTQAYFGARNSSGLNYVAGADQNYAFSGTRDNTTDYALMTNNLVRANIQGSSGNVIFTESITVAKDLITKYLGVEEFRSTDANITVRSDMIFIGQELSGMAKLAVGTENPGSEAFTVLGGSSYFDRDVTISGNLFVNGNTTTFTSNNITLKDSLIYLADENPADTVDIGFVGSFNNIIRYQHTGFVRDATDGTWKLFANVVPEPTTTIDFTNATYSNLQVGNLTLSGITPSTSTTTGALVVTGGVGVGGNLFVGGALTESSSVTLKENITPIDGALDLILQLTGVIYDRRDGSRKNEAGLIAEEVNKVLPNLITLDDQGIPLGVQYTKLTAYLIEAVKSLKAEIDQLKKRD